MFSLLPKEPAFFDLFEKAAANVHEAARALQDLFEKYDDVSERAKRIKDIEHAGDEITHETIQRLNKTFITPIDREDIHELICHLDDVLDLINTAVNRMVLYKVEKPTEDARRLSECLVHATALLMETLPMLRKIKAPENVLQKCRLIHTQENEGDRIEQHALAALFENRLNPIEVIKWKDIYEELEAAIDRCEDVANVIEGIVLKNA